MVNVDLGGMQQETGNQFAALAIRNQFLAGENEALRKKVAALEKELAELKKE
jgi:cell division protein FtsB